MSENDFIAFKKKVLFDKKFNFDNYSQDYVKRRVSVRMMNLKLELGDWAGYCAKLDSDRNEYESLFDAFSVNVTEFFRDPPLWLFLKQHLLPKMADEAAAKGRNSLRIWSAGCSTGEEPYSLAILIKDCIAPKIHVSIVATDIDPDAIARAQEGIYGEAALKNLSVLSPLYLKQHFTNAGVTAYGSEKFRINEDIRGMVQFRKHHFIDDTPFSSLDLILCRNAMIYVGRDTKKKVLSTFHRSLAEGGRLILGKTEVVFASRGGNLFSIESLSEHVYRKIKDPQGDCNG